MGTRTPTLHRATTHPLCVTQSLGNMGPPVSPTAPGPRHSSPSPPPPQGKDLSPPQDTRETQSFCVIKIFRALFTL